MRLADLSPQLRAKVTQALDRAGKAYCLSDVDAGIAQGKYQLWAKPDAVVVTEVQQFPQQRVLCVFLAAGKLESLEPMLEPLMTWAKTEMGCTSAFLVGRFGWLRSFVGSHGFAPTATVMERSL